MPRPKKVPIQVLNENPTLPTTPEFFFKQISSGFFWDIRPDIINGVPSLKINLSAVDAVEMNEQTKERTIYLRCGRVYSLKSQEQILDLYAGLLALHNYSTGKKF